MSVRFCYFKGIGVDGDKHKHSNIINAKIECCWKI
jgi:hypothetical protein